MILACRIFRRRVLGVLSGAIHRKIKMSPLLPLHNSQSDSTVRFSLLSLLVVTTYIACTMAVVSYTKNIVFGVHLTLGLVGWIIWRFAHGHLGGLIPTMLGSDFLLCSSAEWVLHGSEDFLGICLALNVIASLIVLTGIGLFAWVSSKKRHNWLNQVCIAASIFFALVVWWIVTPRLGSAALSHRRALDIAANGSAEVKAISIIEDALRRYGNLPDSDSLYEPLPSVRWDRFTHMIRYQKTSDTTFQLTYIDPSMLFMGDIIVYDSSNPKKGWYRIPF